MPSPVPLYLQQLAENKRILHQGGVKSWDLSDSECGAVVAPDAALIIFQTLSCPVLEFYFSLRFTENGLQM